VTPADRHIARQLTSQVRASAVVTEGWRLLRTGLRRRFTGPSRYEGTAEEICEQIVRKCYCSEQGFFMTSPASYPEFWARDFGRCVPALLSLGFEKEVTRTFEYALRHYEAAGRFALVILPDGRLFDFPAYAPDGFALFMMGLASLSDRTLVHRHRAFLEAEIDRFASLVIDPHTGLVRRKLHYSEAQDYALRDSSCYSNSMCALLQRSLASLGLRNPLADADRAGLIERHFWRGDHYADDLAMPDHPSGDAQLMPFWTGVVRPDPAGRNRLELVLRWMDDRGLNSPFPSRYGVRTSDRRPMHPLHVFNPWQRDTVWTCLGLHLIEVLRDFSHPRFYKEVEAYRVMVERLACFPEVIHSRTANLHTGPLIRAEDSMLWAAGLWSILVSMKTSQGYGQ